jgi:hypothetical protein
MSLRLSVTLVLLAGALSAPIAFQSSGHAEAPRITGRELLTLAQAARGVNYTFDRDTARALEAAELERPPKSADGAALESALRAAGFTLEPVGTNDVFRVRSTHGAGQGS